MGNFDKLWDWPSCARVEECIFVLVTLHVVICGLLIMVIMLQSGKPRTWPARSVALAQPDSVRAGAEAALFFPRPTTWCAIMFIAHLHGFDHAPELDGGASGSSVFAAVSKTSKTPPAVPAPTAPASTPAPALLLRQRQRRRMNKPGR